MGAVKAGAVVDMDVKMAAGNFKFEVEVKIELAVGGDVKKFGRDQPIGSGRGRGAEEIRLHFAESVSDLDDRAEGPAVRAVVDKVERDGIEDVAEDAGESDEMNPDQGGIGRQDRGIGLGEDPSQDIFLDGGLFEAGEGEMVAVAEAVKVPAIVGEEAHPGGGDVDFVKIEREKEDVILELMNFGRETAVHDAALIKAGGRTVGEGHKFKDRIWKLTKLGLSGPCGGELIEENGPGTVESAGEAVLMKAIFEPCSGVIGGLGGGNSVQAGEFSLSLDGRKVEKRVLVSNAAQHFGWINAVVAIERDKVVFLFRDTLEAVHPVVGGGQDCAVRAGIEPVIPRRPAARGAGHQGGIGVQRGGVGLVGKFG